MSEIPRGKWGNQLQFILSAVGYSVGLGNVWRFPYLAYKNGGGAFLIPYLISVVLAGLPLYCLELGLGQYASLGPTVVYHRLAPLYQGLGWGMCIISLNVALYYNVIIAWVIYYLFMSMTSDLPWTHCDKKWNTPACWSILLESHCRQNLTDCSEGVYFNSSCFCTRGDVELAERSRSLLSPMRVSPPEEFFKNYVLDRNHEYLSYHNLGTMNWPLAGCLAAAWLLVFACLSGGVQTSGKVVYFTALFPYAVLLLLLARGVTLDGAVNGLKYYITPDPAKLVDIQVWREAAVQVFFSLSPAQGGLITLASYNQFKNNFVRDATLVTAVDTLTSSFAGLTTFSIIGHAAHLLNQTVATATQSGSGLAFVVFPQVLAAMPGAPFWSFLFFLMLITLGLDSEFVLYETVTTAIIDTYPKLTHRKTLVVGLGCVICFLIGLPFCTQGGLHLFILWDDYSSGYVVMMIALYETAVISYVYGQKRFLKDIQRMIGVKLNAYWRITWGILTPLYMIIIFVFTAYEYRPSELDGKVMPDDAQQLGWFLSALPMMAIVGFGAYRIVRHIFMGKMPWKFLLRSSPLWCPREELTAPSPARHRGTSRMHLLDQKKSDDKPSSQNDKLSEGNKND